MNICEKQGNWMKPIPEIFSQLWGKGIRPLVIGAAITVYGEVNDETYL